MTQEAETVAMDLNIVSCQTCDVLFIESERRQTCPSCGGPPVGPYFQFVLDGDGLRPRGLTVEPPISREQAVKELTEVGYMVEAAAEKVAEWDRRKADAAEAPPATAAVEEEAPAVEGAPTDPEWFAQGVALYLSGGDVTEADLRENLQENLGAEPEAASTAVGRLVAVRDLLRELAAAGVEAQVEVTVEETPAEAPEPAPTPVEEEPPAAPEPPPAGEGEESQPPEAV